MSSAFGNYFPGVTINDAIGDAYDTLDRSALRPHRAIACASAPTLHIRRRIPAFSRTASCPPATAIWSKGRHSLSFGGSWSYTQIKYSRPAHRHRHVATPDFVTFANNWVTPYSTQNFTATTFLQGNADRYYRANETGLFVQDKFQLTPNLTITAGVRYDWNGGLTEKNGNIFNFDPGTQS